MEEPSDGLYEKQKMEEDITEDRHLWRLGMDTWLLAVYLGRSLNYNLPITHSTLKMYPVIIRIMH